MAVPESSSVHRLTNRKEFDAVFKQAKLRVSCAEFLMLVIDNDRKISRIGMVVSRKVAGSAVNRNRIRRLIRETFRLGFDQEGLDIVIVARGATAKLNNAAIRMALCGLWAKIADKHMKAPQ